MGQILFGWNARVLESQASPELLQVAPKPKLALLCSKMKTLLGPMQRYNGSDAGMVRYFIPAREGVSEVAEYNATAQFQKGPGTIHFSALKKKRQVADHGLLCSGGSRAVNERSMSVSSMRLDARLLGKLWKRSRREEDMARKKSTRKTSSKRRGSSAARKPAKRRVTKLVAKAGRSMGRVKRKAKRTAAKVSKAARKTAMVAGAVAEIAGEIAEQGTNGSSGGADATRRSKGNRRHRS
jgi:hypothetical protein